MAQYGTFKYGTGVKYGVTTIGATPTRDFLQQGRAFRVNPNMVGASRPSRIPEAEAKKVTRGS